MASQEHRGPDEPEEGSPYAHEARPRAPADLPRLVATQLIPQLATSVSHRTRTQRDCHTPRAAPSAQEVDRIVEHAMASDIASLVSVLGRLMSEGLPLRAVLLDAIAPSARRLGAMWETDEVGWMETTVGLAALERVIAVLTHDTPPAELTPNRGLIALFAEPDEQHTLSIRVVGELFRQAGHRVLVDPWMSAVSLVELVQREHVEMIGMTSTMGTNASQVRVLIDDVRRFSNNPNILVVIGGPSETAAYARDVGATYCAEADDALRLLRAAAHGRGGNVE